LIQGLNQSRGRTAGVYVEVKEPAKHREAGLDASTQILKVLTEYGYDAADDPIFLQCFDKAEVIRIRNELKSPLPLIYLLGKAPTAMMISKRRLASATGWVFCTRLLFPEPTANSR
jgi:glycerophosphoryl diester phosphodiesterase